MVKCSVGEPANAAVAVSAIVLATHVARPAARKDGLGILREGMF